MSVIERPNYLSATGTPRRCRVDLATPIEAKLREARQAIEEGGADVRMTAASIKVGEALELVADYLEETGNIKPE